MRRNILLITTDQQRYDGLGFAGGEFAKTPVLDRLATTGLQYRQARNQCAVCMPAIHQYRGSLPQVRRCPRYSRVSMFGCMV